MQKYLKVIKCKRIENDDNSYTKTKYSFDLKKKILVKMSYKSKWKKKTSHIVGINLMRNVRLWEQWKGSDSTRETDGDKLWE